MEKGTGKGRIQQVENPFFFLEFSPNKADSFQNDEGICTLVGFRTKLQCNRVLSGDFFAIRSATLQFRLR
jgi:hypothetical protein